VTWALLLSLLAGALLGWRFTVWILLPAIAGALPIVIGVQVIRQQSLAAVVLMSVAVVTGLQLGYLGSIFFRSWM
jgi:hypothetical protein